MYFRFVLFRTELFYSRFFGVISCPRSLLLLLVLLLILLSALSLSTSLGTCSARSIPSHSQTHTGTHTSKEGRVGVGVLWLLLRCAACFSLLSTLFAFGRVSVSVLLILCLLCLCLCRCQCRRLTVVCVLNIFEYILTTTNNNKTNQNSSNSNKSSTTNAHHLISKKTDRECFPLLPPRLRRVVVCQKQIQIEETNANIDSRISSLCHPKKCN